MAAYGGGSIKIDASDLSAVVKVTCVAECRHNAIYRGQKDQGYHCDFKHITIMENGACESFEKITEG